MGYHTDSLTIHARLERHNSDDDRRDDAAWERLKAEINALIDSDPEYTRIAGFFGHRLAERVEAVQPGLIHYRRTPA